MGLFSAASSKSTLAARPAKSPIGFDFVAPVATPSPTSASLGTPAIAPTAILASTPAMRLGSGESSYDVPAPAAILTSTPAAIASSPRATPAGTSSSRPAASPSIELTAPAPRTTAHETSFSAAPVESNNPVRSAPRTTSHGFAVAPELESAVDTLWARLRQLPSAAPAGQNAFVITHWEPGEGASTLAAALALRAAQLEPARSFCLADFDFATRGLSRLTGFDAELGLSNVVAGPTPLEALLSAKPLPNLTIAPAGRPNFTRRVTAMHDRCREVAAQLAARFDYVFLDVPCLRDHPNYCLWAGGFAQAVLVVRAGRARNEAVEKAIRTLEVMQLEVAGVALNAREFHVPGWLYSRT